MFLKIMNSLRTIHHYDCKMIHKISYTQSHIKSDEPGSHVFRWFLGQFSWNFVTIIFQQNPNIPENFVKLFIVFQK